MTIRPLSLSATPLPIALTAAVALLFAAPLAAANKNLDYTSLAGVKAPGFQKWLDDAKDQGYEPYYINGYDVGDHVEYAGVAVKDPDKKPFECKYDLTDDAYKDFFDEMNSKGFRCTSVSGYHTKAGPRFAACWVKDKNKRRWRAKHDQSEKEYRDTVRSMRKDEYVPNCVTAYQGPDGAVRFTSLFVESLKGEEFETPINMTANQYQDQLDAWRASGFHISRVHVYDTPDGLRFLATARSSDYDRRTYLWQEHHNMTGNEYQEQFDKLAGEGFRPGCICGYRDGGEVKFAVIWNKSK